MESDNTTTRRPDRLDPITLGLGARLGYSGDDLTNAMHAAERGEVPYLPEGAAKAPLELRIHGVGGAPPADNLESPATLQVAGDSDAGFYRAWYPGGDGARTAPRVEAYCWGKLNTGSRWAGLWPLLLPFGLINVAYWALPAKTDPHTGVRIPRRNGALIRLLGLVLTTSFIATAAYLAIDVVAWQRAGEARTWTWVHLYMRWGTGVRMALASIPVFLIIVLLYLLSRRTQGRYEERESGHGLPETARAEWALTARTFWQGSVPLGRQRCAHMTMAAAVVMTVLALPRSSHPAWRAAILVAAAVFAAWAIAVVASPWTDRLQHAGHWDKDVASGRVFVRRIGLDIPDRLNNAVQLAALVCAGAVAVARALWSPSPTRIAGAIPWDRTVQSASALAGFGLLALLAVSLAFDPCRGAVRRGGGATIAKSEQRRPVGEVMGFGFASVGIAGLAVTMSAVFGGTLTLTAANVLGQPVYTKPGSHKHPLSVPETVFASGATLLTVIAAALLTGIAFALRWLRIRNRLLGRGGLPGDTVAAIYTDRSAGTPGRHAAAASVAGTWAMAKLTDGAAAMLFGLVLPAAAGFVAFTGYFLSTTTPDTWLVTTSGWGATLGVLATASFLVFVRSAFTDIAARKRFGFFWDVMTFWPRAANPFGPPCYAERTIPEVVTRIRRIADDPATDLDDTSDPAVAIQHAASCADGTVSVVEQHSPVLLVGYSQGCPIATAVVAQLPESVIPDVALLTLASPVRRLYGRTFPSFFGRPALHALTAVLQHPPDPPRPVEREPLPARWLNLVRESDYIGGYVIAPPIAGEDDPLPCDRPDRMIWDPPVLCDPDDPAPPPTHLHSDWFPDPQTRPYAERLLRLLQADDRAREPTVPTVPLGSD